MAIQVPAPGHYRENKYSSWYSFRVVDYPGVNFLNLALVIPCWCVLFKSDERLEVATGASYHRLLCRSIRARSGRGFLSVLLRDE